MKKVMVFGTFDGLHEGHRAFLREAGAHGDYLIAVIPEDRMVERLKGHLPKLNLAERFDNLKKEDGVDEIVTSGEAPGTWDVVKKYKPEVIAVGYDQYALKENLENHLDDLGYTPEVKVMHNYEKNA